MYYIIRNTLPEATIPIEAGCLSKLSETSTELLYLKLLKDMQLQQQHNDDDDNNNNKQIRLTHH